VDAQSPTDLTYLHANPAVGAAKFNKPAPAAVRGPAPR